MSYFIVHHEIGSIYCHRQIRLAVPVELTEADERILDVLSAGRCTVGYLADETGYSRQHVHNRLNVLLAAEYVEKVHGPTGLYELRTDPRD